MGTSKDTRLSRILWGLLTTFLVLLVATPIALIAYTRPLARRASCANDVKVVALYLEDYAATHNGQLPPIHPIRGNITMDPAGFYPDIMPNSKWVQCEYSEARRHPTTPGETDLGPEGFNDGTFFYLPWALHNEEEGLAFAAAYKTLDLNHRDNALTITTPGGVPRALPRVHYQSQNDANPPSPTPEPVPILVEWPHDRHADLCVLYNDGSVHCLKMGERFPATKAFMAAMHEIAQPDQETSTAKGG